MKYVNEYFNFYEYANPNHSKIRNVYLASDEIKVYDEALSKFPNYNFIFNKTYIKNALTQSRNELVATESIILDVYFLSQCDYLVCTFSSNVCRLAYVLLQSNYPDGSWRFKSLDDVYYFIGSHLNIFEVIYDHKAKKELGEIDLISNDLIALSGNHWDGYSKGVNLRTNQVGLFPSYKIKRLINSF
jgi:glycoprotein 6-alpha-L-fucosyltransferase